MARPGSTPRSPIAGGFGAAAGWCSQKALRIDNAGATLDRPAIGAGARALATLVRIAPDAPASLEPLRAASRCRAEVEAGASVVDGVLVARLASPSPQKLREALIAAYRRAGGRGRAEGLVLIRWAIAAALALACMQALAAANIELTFDEAYYAMWARFPQAGYLDHPPLVAWTIAARRRCSALPSSACGLCSGSKGRACRRWSAGSAGGSTSATAATAVLILVGAPLLAGAPLATPDTPLTFFWTLALVGLVEVWWASERGRPARLLGLWLASRPAPRRSPS